MLEFQSSILEKLEQINQRLGEVESGLAALGGLVARISVAKNEIALECYLPGSASPGDAAEKIILVVEDDPSSQLIYRHILHNLGYGVVSVSDGKEALQVYNTLRPDMVLMDIGLPSLDGFETSRAIRQLEYSKGLTKAPIVCVTASSGDDVEVLARNCGMDEYFLKPIDFVAFQSVVGKWCTQS